MDTKMFWVMVILGGLTYGIRVSFLLFAERMGGAERSWPLLGFIPAAVFAALAIPLVIRSVHLESGVDGWSRLVASLVAFGVAWYSRSTWWTLFSGMGALALWKLLLQ